MSRVKSLLMCVLFAVPFLHARAESPVAAEARRVLSNTRDTLCQHKREVDEAAGRYRLDGSGFAAVVLRRVNPIAMGRSLGTSEDR